MLFGASYYPHHRDPACWDYDLDNMVAAHVNAIRVGDFAWSRLETRENHWDFSWLDTFLDKAHARRIGVLLIPSLRCAPAWLMEKEPSIGIINEEGIRLEFGSRYTFCINHPVLREKGLALADKMARRYAGHPSLLGWHLDNEYGDEPDCHCPICRQKWQQWLQTRYQTLEQLNRSWGTVFWSLEFDRWEQIPTPRLSKTYHNPGLLLAWRHFRSDCTVEIVGLHAAALRKHDSRLPVTTNLQCLWNPRTNYTQMAKHLDLAGMNYYPPYGPKNRDNALGIAVVRGLLPQNIQIHELRNGAHAVPGRVANDPEPGEIERLTLHCIGHGADAIFYFAWKAVPFGPEQTHGTLTDYDGRPNRTYVQCQHIGANLQRIAPLLQGTRVHSDIAVIYDFPTRWSMQGNAEWIGPDWLFLEHTKKVYNSIRELGINCDAISREGNFTAYKVLVVPLLNCLDDALVQRLQQFVASGGTLIWHPLSGTKNPDTEIFPARLHPGLEKLLGISLREYTGGAQGESRFFTWNQQRYQGEMFFDLPQLQGASKLGEFVECWFAGSAAVTCHQHGRGQAWHIACFASQDFYRDFLGYQCRQAGIQCCMGKQVPREIEVLERSAADGRKLIFLLNSSNRPQTFAVAGVWQDIWSQQQVSGDVPFAPWQVRILEQKT